MFFLFFIRLLRFPEGFLLYAVAILSLVLVRETDITWQCCSIVFYFVMMHILTTLYLFKYVISFGFKLTYHAFNHFHVILWNQSCCI